MLKRALFFLKFRPRSEAEVRAYLVKKGGQAQDINEAVDKLKRMKFIDDEEFIKFWLRRRQARPRAGWVIRLELGKLGIDRELLDKVLGDQRQADRQRAQAMADKMRGRDQEKVWAALARRGFDWDTIRGVKLGS